MSVSAAIQQPHVFPTSDRLTIEVPADKAREKPAKELTMFAEEEPSFWDVLDVINPLQHIPVINTIYREITGDQIGVGARMVGGVLFGGPIGLAAAAANCMLEEATGEDMGGHVLALFKDEQAPADQGAPQFAAGDKPASAPAPSPPAASAEPPPASTPAPDLPQPVAAMPPASAMMFTADGPVMAGAEAAPAMAAAVPPKAAPAAPSPTATEARFMPVPPRTAGMRADTAPPVITVPVSTNGAPSQAAVVGRNPVTGPSPLTVQKILAEQGHKDARHPMVPGSGAPTPDGRSPDWFTSAMMAGLDKYEQAAKLGRDTGSEVVPLQ